MPAKKKFHQSLKEFSEQPLMIEFQKLMTKDNWKPNNNKFKKKNHFFFTQKIPNASIFITTLVKTWVVMGIQNESSTFKTKPIEFGSRTKIRQYMHVLFAHRPKKTQVIPTKRVLIKLKNSQHKY